MMIQYKSKQLQQVLSKYIIQSQSTNIWTCLCYVTNPFIWNLVIHQTLKWFNLQPRCTVIGDLEIQIDGACLFHSLGWICLWKSYLGHETVLCITCHFLYCPFNCVIWLIVIHFLVSLVFDYLRIYIRNLFGYIKLHNYERCNCIFREHRFQLN